MLHRGASQAPNRIGSSGSKLTPDMIVTGSGLLAREFGAATSTIQSFHPRRKRRDQGFVACLVRSGGKVTGVSTDTDPKFGVSAYSC
jgi:hypothetical protein